MQVSLVVVEGNGEYVAHATVTDAGKVKAKMMVEFRANGQAISKPEMTGVDGVASVSLKLKPGQYTILACLANARGIADDTYVTITKTQKITPGTEWILSLIFIGLTLKFGYSTFTVLSLIASILILLARSAIKFSPPPPKAIWRLEDNWAREAWLRLKNNDWVFFTYVGMFTVSFFFWLFSFDGTPITDFNGVDYALDKIGKGLFPPPTDPWANDWSFTKLLLSEKGGWGMATILHLFFLPFAYLASFQDNIRKGLKEYLGGQKKEKGLLHWVLGDFAMEVFYKVTGLFRGGNG